MPLKPLDKFVYPDDLPLRPEVAEGSWWVLHTRPRAEKVIAERFCCERRSVFLPLRKQEHTRSNRTRYAYNPLFPGYLFVRGSAEVRQAALETNRVAAVLPVSDQEGLNNALAGIYRSMQAGLLLADEQRYQPGAPVVIESGFLKGTVGKVICQDGEHRFLIELEIIGRAVSVRYEGWAFRPLRQKEEG
jgi:transcription antitermination factor NusG